MERTRPVTPASDATRDAAEHDGSRIAPAPEERPAPGDTVGEAEAQLVWRAAARLQAEAARRLEGRSQALARGHQSDRAPGADSAAFTRAEVAEIAEAAGIDPSFVALAWREVEAEQLRPSTVSDGLHRRASAFLGTDAERMSVTRTFRAGPEAVLAAMQQVLPADPYRLTLAEVVGDADALTDAVFIFDVPQVAVQAAQTGGYTPFSYAMSIADLTRAVVTLHPLGDGGTEATVTVDLRHGKAVNFKVGAWLTGAAAAVLGAVGFALGDGGAAVAAAGLGASGGGGLTYAGYRAAYAAGLKKGERALEEMLRAVDLRLRSGGAFAPVPPTSPAPRGDNGSAFVIGFDSQRGIGVRRL